MKNKEEIIVFQNQSQLVERYFTNCGICPDLLDICLVTDLMVEFATKGYSPELKTRFEKMEVYLNKQYRGVKES
jgi:hypothetical protein